MKLAQCIILDLLKDYDPVPILPETCDFHFSGVQLLDQDNPTDDPSILYIGTTTQISSFDTEKLKDFYGKSYDIWDESPFDGFKDFNEQLAGRKG